MLGARIPNEYARKLGDRLGKLVFGPAASLPKERTALGRAHDKRVGRLSKLNPDYELKLLALSGQSDRDHATFDGKPVTIKLPNLEECHAAAPPPPPPTVLASAPDPLEAWCQRNVVVHELFKRQLPERRYERAQVERAWRPQTYRERKRFEQTRQMQKRHNNACTCDDDVPSWLCQVHLCWALEVGMCEGDTRGPRNARKKPSRRVRCDCMQDAYRDEDPRVRPWHRDLLVWQEEAVHGEMRLPFSWLDAPPGGWYGPDYCPRKAARALAAHEVMEWEERSRAPCD